MNPNDDDRLARSQVTLRLDRDLLNMIDDLARDDGVDRTELGSRQRGRLQRGATSSNGSISWRPRPLKRGTLRSSSSLWSVAITAPSFRLGRSMASRFDDDRIDDRLELGSVAGCCHER
jgi:hypothetical protein